VSEPTPAQFHRSAAANFTRLVEGTRDWSATAPVPGWTARDVVEHLLTWLPAMIAEGTSVELPTGPDLQADLIGAWRHQTVEVQRLLDDPATASLTFSSDQLGDLPLAQMLSNFYIIDIFMHSWDLAKATGQEHGLLDTDAAAALEAMLPMDEMMRGEHFGPKQPVATDAGGVDQLMAFIGRDPNWSAG